MKFVIGLITLLVIVALCNVHAGGISAVYSDTMCPCPRIYRPVCASNGQNFSNKCLFDCAARSPLGIELNLRIARDGRCDESNYDDADDDSIEMWAVIRNKFINQTKLNFIIFHFPWLIWVTFLFIICFTINILCNFLFEIKICFFFRQNSKRMQTELNIFSIINQVFFFYLS